MLSTGSSSAFDLTIYQHDSELRPPPVAPMYIPADTEVNGGVSLTIGQGSNML
jgi:hypothetical protein